MRIPNLTRYQLAIEILCFLLTLACIIVTVMVYPSMPEKIPSHYGASGNITDYRGRGTAFVLPAVNFFLYALLTLMICIPSLIENPNTPWPINPAMKPFVARETVSLLGECKLITILIFGYMQIFTLRCTELSVWPVWLLIVLMTALCIVYTRRIKKYKI